MKNSDSLEQGTPSSVWAEVENYFRSAILRYKNRRIVPLHAARATIVTVDDDSSPTPKKRQPLTSGSKHGFSNRVLPK